MNGNSEVGTLPWQNVAKNSNQKHMTVLDLIFLQHQYMCKNSSTLSWLRNSIHKAIIVFRNIRGDIKKF